MDNGETFLDDVISDGFFGQENDAGASDFSWADEFISSSEDQETIQNNAGFIQPNHEIENANISSSIPIIASQNALSVSTQSSFLLANTAGQFQMANQNAGIQFVQQQNQTVSQQVMTSLPIGSGAQLVRGPNGQLMLKPITGNQIQQSQPNLQLSNANQSQFQTPHLASLTSNQSPIPVSSPAVSRVITPASSPLVSRSVTPLQYSSATTETKVHGHQVVANLATNSPNVNLLQIHGNSQQQLLTRNIQVQGVNQLPTANTSGFNIQGQSIIHGQNVLQNQGQMAYIQGHGQTAVLQGQTGQTAVLQGQTGQTAVLQGQTGQTSVLQGQPGQTTVLQGQPGQTAMLQGQGQNIVNTQNTVIQNPNVVNLNVAHVLCNNPALQNQQGGTSVHPTQNIQGTLIQTADGKNIIIPSQQLQSGQPINIQNLQQMFQQQINVPQSSTGVLQGNVSGTGVLQGTAVLGNNVALGGIGNVIRLPLATGQDKNTNTNATHFIGVNNQGQQVLIPRPQNQQNIVVRTIAPQNTVQIQQPTGSSGATNTSTQYQISQPSQVIQQPLLVTSQHSGVQLQRIISGQQVLTNQQGQTLKVISQPQLQNLNLGSNISFQNLQSNQIQTVQFVPQQVQRPASVKNEENVTPQIQPLIQFATASTSTTASCDSSLKTMSFVTKSVSQGTPQQVSSVQTSIPISTMQPHLSQLNMPSISIMNVVATTTSQTHSAISQPIFTTTQQIPHVVPSVVTPQPVSDQSTPFKQHPTLQARHSAPKLQTIQLTPDAQKKLQSIQIELNNLKSLKQMTNEDREKQQKLREMRNSVLQSGQVIIKQQATAVSVTQPMIGQPQASYAPPNIVIKKEEPPEPQPMIGEPPLQQTILSKAQQVSSQSSNPSMSNSPSPLLKALSSTAASIRPVVSVSSNQTPQVNRISTTLSNQIQNTQSAVTAPSLVQSLGTLPTTVVQPGTTAARPGVQPATASQAPIPTQIKIANHILQLNLTPAQKSKVEEYLSKMTPEQQQQQITLFLRLQQQQQMQAQVQAQVRAQQNLQQNKIPAPAQNISSAKPAAVTSTSQGPLSSTIPDKMRVTVASIPKDKLIHQQLSKDQENALRPDTHSKYRDKRDMTRRLLRYHVCHWKEPPEKLVKKDEDMFENCAQGLMRKSGAMFEKFRLLLMKESMREKKTSEMVMIQRLLNEDLKETVQKEKQQVKDDPDSFIPMPKELLLKSESPKVTVKEEMELNPVVKEEKDAEEIPLCSSHPFRNIKMEEDSNSRPSTPKFKLIIRNDGEKLTSSTCIAEDADSDSNTYVPDQNLSNQSSTDSYCDNQSPGSPFFSNLERGHIKSEPIEIDDSTEDNSTAKWSDISNDDKPFSSYMNSENNDAVTGLNFENFHDKNEMTGAVENDHGKMDSISEKGLFSDSSEAVNNLMSAEGRMEYSHSDTFHSTSQVDSLCQSLPFSSRAPSSAYQHGNEIECSQTSLMETDSSFSTLDMSQPSFDNSINSYPQSTLAQYEPISSDEGGDETENFSDLMQSKSSTFSLGIGDQSIDFMQNSNQSYSQTDKGKNDENPDANVMEIADGNWKNDSGSSSDSDSDSDSSSVSEGPDKHQMQSAIDSILHLNNDISSHHSSTYLNQSNPSFVNNHEYDINQSEDSAINSPQSYDRREDSEHTEDTNSMDDDLDAAVKSILM